MRLLGASPNADGSKIAFVPKNTLPLTTSLPRQYCCSLVPPAVSPIVCPHNCQFCSLQDLGATPDSYRTLKLSIEPELPFVGRKESNSGYRKRKAMIRAKTRLPSSFRSKLLFTPVIIRGSCGVVSQFPLGFGSQMKPSLKCKRYCFDGSSVAKVLGVFEANSARDQVSVRDQVKE